MKSNKKPTVTWVFSISLNVIGSYETTQKVEPVGVEPTSENVCVCLLQA